MIEIIKDKCVGCSQCTVVCPTKFLKMEEGQAMPQQGRFCMRCMHCGAVCKKDAILFNGEKTTVGNVAKIENPDFASDLEKHIMSRRSYRHFEDRPVDRKVISHVLEQVAWAPSAKNQHKIGWIVIDSKEVIDRIMEEIIAFSKKTGTSKEILAGLLEGNNVVMGNAHTLILAYGHNKSINPAADVAIAMTTAELLFQSRGIGTCWAGYLTRMSNGVEGIKDLLAKLPEDYSFYGAFMLGYPENEEYHFIPARIKKSKIDFV